MNNNIKYIQDNFIETDKLCSIVGIHEDQLNNLIRKERHRNETSKPNLIRLYATRFRMIYKSAKKALSYV